MPIQLLPDRCSGEVHWFIEPVSHRFHTSHLSFTKVHTFSIPSLRVLKLVEKYLTLICLFVILFRV